MREPITICAIVKAWLCQMTRMWHKNDVIRRQKTNGCSRIVYITENPGAPICAEHDRNFRDDRDFFYLYCNVFPSLSNYAVLYTRAIWCYNKYDTPQGCHICFIIPNKNAKHKRGKLTEILDKYSSSALLN